MQMLLRAGAQFDLAVRVRQGAATLGEAFEFTSGLYFRGKRLYARTFARPPGGVPGVLVITPGAGLVPEDTLIRDDQLRALRDVPVHENEPRFTAPLLDSANLLASAAPDAEVVLLGSIASAKYVDPLLSVFGERLLFPPTFVGRGDMSRGGLLLRCARTGGELEYAPVHGAVRHGPRPPRLPPMRRTDE
jgi:hypothetical protein